VSSSAKQPASLLTSYPDYLSVPPNNSGVGGGGSGETMNMAQRLKLKKLCEEFQELVDEKTVRTTFFQLGFHYEATVAELLGLYPDLANRKQERDRQRERERLRQQSKQSSQTLQQRKLHDIIKDLKKNKNKVGWVDTGEVVGEQYSALREKAIEHARIRNRLFQEATKAYVLGNKSAATQLSARGRFHQKKMEELHQQACQEIFQSRNSSHPDVLDLHGLHVDEALSVLEKFLLKQQALPQSGPSVYTDVGAWPSANCSMSDIGGSGLNGSRGSSKSSDLHKLVYVITGTGHHSQSKKARLQPAVQKFLTERGYSFEDVSSDGRGGMITITINS